MSESGIIKSIKEGSKEVLQGLYTENKDAFVQFILSRYTVSNDDAEDIYQDAVIALVENIRKGKLDNINSSLKTYLFSIGKYMALKKFKEQQKTINTEFGVLAEFIEWEEDTYADGNEALIRLIQLKLKEMSPACKKILIWFYYEEKRLDEIVQLGHYAGKDVVKSQKSRCLAALKKMVYEK